MVSLSLSPSLYPVDTTMLFVHLHTHVCMYVRTCDLGSHHSWITSRHHDCRERVQTYVHAYVRTYWWALGNPLEWALRFPVAWVWGAHVRTYIRTYVRILATMAPRCPSALQWGIAQDMPIFCCDLSLSLSPSLRTYVRIPLSLSLLASHACRISCSHRSTVGTYVPST